MQLFRFFILTFPVLVSKPKIQHVFFLRPRVKIGHFRNSKIIKILKCRREDEISWIKPVITKQSIFWHIINFILFFYIIILLWYYNNPDFINWSFGFKICTFIQRRTFLRFCETSLDFVEKYIIINDKIV